MKKPTKRKPTARETSDRVSRIAARVLRKHEHMKSQGTRPFCWPCNLATTGEVLALAASCLAQDQTKGKRK